MLHYSRDQSSMAQELFVWRGNSSNSQIISLSYTSCPCPIQCIQCQCYRSTCQGRFSVEHSLDWWRILLYSLISVLNICFIIKGISYPITLLIKLCVLAHLVTKFPFPLCIRWSEVMVSRKSNLSRFKMFLSIMVHSCWCYCWKMSWHFCYTKHRISFFPSF